VPSYSVQILIEAPPEAVFDHVADLPAHGAWSTDALDIVATGDGVFRSSTRAKGKDITAELTVIERTPPTRFVFDAVDLTGRWRHTFTLTPANGGTMLRRDIAGSLGGAQLLLYWLVVLPIKKPNALRSLRTLKALVERAR
jgi:hypothetical protein